MPRLFSLSPASLADAARPASEAGIARSARPARRAARVAAVLAAAALALTACTATGQNPAPVEVTGEVPDGLESYYSQGVDWKKCDLDFECATISAPLDYEKPQGSTIKLSLTRLKATGTKRGSLLMNPGGPGGSGVKYLHSGGSYTFGADVKAVYDLVGFDPRGVGGSTAVACLSDEQKDQQRASTVIPSTEAEVEEMIKDSKTFADACAANSPEGLLAHVDTDSAARDLDLIRGVLGEAKLDYVGFSYGTKLGATFAGLFPANVGRLVLDGAMDTSLDVEQVSTGQAVAFERSLELYLQTCLDSAVCPFTGDVAQAKSQFSEWVAGLEDAPMQVGERTLSAADAVQATLLGLYEPRSADRVSQSLYEAMEDKDATGLLDLADLSLDRDTEGHYSNTNDAFLAINCQDYNRGTANPKEILERGKRLEAQAPFFGRFMGYDDQCSQWSEKPTHAPAAIDAPSDLTPLLIVGTTGDPATPYAWSQALQKQLPNSSLLTWEGEGHTAYGRSNQCVAAAVEDFLVDGTLPEDGKRC